MRRKPRHAWFIWDEDPTTCVRAEAAGGLPGAPRRLSTTCWSAAPKGLCLDTNLQSVVWPDWHWCYYQRKVLFGCWGFCVFISSLIRSLISAFFHWQTHFCTFPCPFLWQKRPERIMKKILINGYNMPLRKTHSISKRAQGKLKKDVRAKECH